jgi:hypothetical protein
MTRTGLDLDAVLNALRTLEVDVAVLRTWGECPMCAKKNRAMLSIA